MRSGKNWLWAILAPAVLGLAVGSHVANGQDKPNDDSGVKPVQKEQSTKPQGDGAKPSKRGAEFGEFGDLIKELGLSEEQQAKFHDAVKAGQDARAAWESENAAKMAELRNARSEAKTAGNEDAIRKIDGDMKELFRGLQELMQKQREDALAVLTPEQREKLGGLEVYRAVLGRYQGMVQGPGAKDKSRGAEAEQPAGPLQLTEEQKEKIKTICASAAKEGAPADEKRKGPNPAQVAFLAVCDQVLTAEQKVAVTAAQLQQMVMGKALAVLGGSKDGNDPLKLTEEQLVKIKTICDHAAGNLDTKPDEKGNVPALPQVIEEVKDILTPEQRAAVEKWMEQQSGKRGGEKSAGVPVDKGK